MSVSSREPVLLTVLIETANLRWHVAGIGLSGEIMPLVRSEIGNLKSYIGSELDEQVTFLRHRLSGVLQRGCDRLWGRQKKPCHVVFVADGPFSDAAIDLTSRVAEHFVTWLTSPPVVFYTSDGRFRPGEPVPLTLVAGQLTEEYRKPFETGLTALVTALNHAEEWETLSQKSVGGQPQR